MAWEVSVERQFRFHCSCGATMVSGERTVVCTACSASLGVRRARRRRQQMDSVAYYGSRTLPVHRVVRYRHTLDTIAATPNPTIISILSAWFKSALAYCGEVLSVSRVGKHLRRTESVLEFQEALQYNLRSTPPATCNRRVAKRTPSYRDTRQSSTDLSRRKTTSACGQDWPDHQIY